MGLHEDLLHTAIELRLNLLRIFVLAVVILVNFALQSALLPHFAIMEVTPDTALVLIVSYGILRGDIEGGIFGLAAGFVQDALGSSVIGLFALLGFLTGYLCGKPFRDFFKDNYFLPFFVVVVVAFFYQLILYATTIMIFGQIEFSTYLRTIIFPKTIYTASLSVPVYAFLHFVNVRIERRESFEVQE